MPPAIEIFLFLGDTGYCVTCINNKVAFHFAKLCPVSVAGLVQLHTFFDKKAADSLALYRSGGYALFYGDAGGKAGYVILQEAMELLHELMLLKNLRDYVSFVSIFSLCFPKRNDFPDFFKLCRTTIIFCNNFLVL